MLNTTFHRSQKVTAKMTAQGMTEGQTYEVTQVLVNPMPWGTFVTYELDGTLYIRNGHILLQAVEA